VLTAASPTQPNAFGLPQVLQGAHPDQHGHPALASSDEGLPRGVQAAPAHPVRDAREVWGAAVKVLRAYSTCCAGCLA